MIKKIIHLLTSLPITIWFNFKVFPINQALSLPILIDYRTKIKGINKGCIHIPPHTPFATIKYGWGEGSAGNHCNKRNHILFFGKGRIFFAGKAQFALGATLRCDNNGTISFGVNFKANQNFSCFSNTEIKFGNNNLIGWNVNVRDSDGHDIIHNEKIVNPNKAINIGNHVWITSHVDILKGASISDNSIVGFRSLVTKKFKDSNVIIAGNPASIIKTDINWKE